MASSTHRDDGENAIKVESNGLHTPPVLCWQQTLAKYEGGGYSVIDIPKIVMEQTLFKDLKLITLIDEKNSKSYECEIETVNVGSNERYICKGWFKCVEEMGLKDGDKLFFTVDNPPKKMYVYELVGDD